MNFRTHLNLLLLSLLALPVSALELIRRQPADLPALSWQSNDSSIIWAAADATAGGNVQIPLSDFPPHLQRIGSHSSHSLRPLLESLHLPLMARHPADHQWLPMLASHWFFDTEHGILYVTLHEQARWSDGIPVTSNDIHFTLEFLTNPSHQTHWQRQRLLLRLQRAEFFDNRRFALHLHPPYADALEELAALRPLATHYYSAKGWPERFQWQPEPVTGPYRISQIKHNDSITLRRDNAWWGHHLRYFSQRFNARQVTLRTRSDKTTAERFSLAEFDWLEIPEDNLQQPGMQSLWREKKITLTGLSHADPAIQAILLSHPAPISTAASAAAPELLYHQHDCGWSGSKHKIPASVLIHAVRNEHYHSACLTFSPPISHAQLNAWLMDQDIKAEQPGSLKALPSPAITYTLHWSWVRLPDNPVLPHLNRLFDPFDAVAGGLFWIDRKRRTDVMANPQRPPGITPVPHIIGPAAQAAELVTHPL